MVKKSTTVPPKVMHLPGWQCVALEQEAENLTARTGVKVTQVQLVREALDEMFTRMGVDRDFYVAQAARRFTLRRVPVRKKIK